MILYNGRVRLEEMRWRVYPRGLDGLTIVKALCTGWSEQDDGFC